SEDGGATWANAPDGSTYCNGDQVRVTFNATSGTTYFIAVDGFFAASGSVTLHLTQLPPTAGNNMFLFAANLTGTTAQAIASNSTATRE
ncbi:MAG TPA: hypothetical protein PKX00_20935, partial [Opitutaceae bacterium]|nr:hypothetical protein [Opitutaceae bacterium]